MVVSWPWSMSQPTRSTRPREASTAIFMSAILSATDSNLPMGLPNCLRCRAYATHGVHRPAHRPTWLAMMQARSQRMDVRKISAAVAGPAEHRDSEGTKQSSRTTSAIGEVRRPIFSRGLRPREPLACRPRRGRPSDPERPDGLRLRPDEHDDRSATGALVMKVFRPLRTYPPSTARPVARMPNASEPGLGLGHGVAADRAHPSRAREPPRLLLVRSRTPSAARRWSTGARGWRTRGRCRCSRAQRLEREHGGHDVGPPPPNSSGAGRPGSARTPRTDPSSRENS